MERFGCEPSPGIEQLYDFSIVSDPAYSETTADVRSRLSGTPRGDAGTWQGQPKEDSRRPA